MKTIVFGKNVKNYYNIETNQKEITKDGKTKLVFTGKPNIIKTPETKEYIELCSFKGEPRYNSSSRIWGLFGKNSINISAKESVGVEEEIFRADLNELHMITDKIIEEDNSGKTEAENEYLILIGAFNEQMIESNDKLSTYCKIHNLNPKVTDCFELFKIVFPDKKYEISDGIMKIKEIKNVCTTTSAWYNHPDSLESITCSKEEK